MKRIGLSLPMFEFIVITRAALGVGAGLLAADRLSAKTRRGVSGLLVALGLLSTIPAVHAVRQTQGNDRSPRSPTS